MLQPKRTKFRKARKDHLEGSRQGKRVFGTVGLRAMECGRISARQLEAARRAVRHHLDREGRRHICVFPDTPVTIKPTEVRMGKGKGAVSW